MLTTVSGTVGGQLRQVSLYKNTKCVTFVNYRIRNELKEKRFFILYSVVFRMSNFVTLGRVVA